MYDFCIITPTYNRLNLLFDEVKQIHEEAERMNYQIVHCILDDGSDPQKHPYLDVVPSWRTKNYIPIFKRHDENFGRIRFWKTWQDLIVMAKKQVWRYAIAIPDDVFLCRDFMTRSRDSFILAKEEEGGIPCVMNLRPFSLNGKRWIDGAFICEEEFFGLTEWKLSEPNSKILREDESQKKKEYPRGSGVGYLMTKGSLAKKPGAIARLKSVSFLKARDVPSVMFPENEYINRPRIWGLQNFIDDMEPSIKDA